MQLLFAALAAAAALAGVSALHPELRLLSEGMRQTLEVARILHGGEDHDEDHAQEKAAAKCINALVPPSITSYLKCIGVDLGAAASGDEAAMEAALAALTQLTKDGEKVAGFTTFSKESCTALFQTKVFKCAPIIFASDPAAYLKANPFPTSVDKLPAGCADIKDIVSKNATESAECTAALNSPNVTLGSTALAGDCGQTPDGKNGFADGKKMFATVFNECAKTGVDPTAGLAPTDAAAIKTLMGATAAPSGSPSGFVASVVLAAAAVVVAL
jgi:hypothetical protein